jgi:hypothetical protein
MSITRSHSASGSVAAAPGVELLRGDLLAPPSGWLAGIEGIVNFAPVTLALPPHVQNVGVDLAIELEQLSFAVTSKLARAATESTAQAEP